MPRKPPTLDEVKASAKLLAIHSHDIYAHVSTDEAGKALVVALKKQKDPVAAARSMMQGIIAGLAEAEAIRKVDKQKHIESPVARIKKLMRTHTL